jgi:uncharacterized protein YukJ
MLGAMSLSTYGVLKGRVLNRRMALGGSSRHYQIEVKEILQHSRVSVNVCSQEHPSELEVAILEPFHHPLTEELARLSPGFVPLPRKPGGLALDYIRANPARPGDFRVIPANLPGPDNDMNERLDELVKRCANTPGAFIYAFGQPWGPNPRQYDGVFHFKPEAGLHNVHMNQGNSEFFAHDDGVWQDGGLVFQFGNGPDDWVAVLLKFQSQSWHTDDRLGHRVTPPEGPRGARLHSAIINGAGQPELEMVTIRNEGHAPLDLTGWSLANWQKQLMPLPSQVVKPGEIADILLEPPFSLPNHGGVITLLDKRGRKMDGVAYTREDGRTEDAVIRFHG